MIIKLINFNWNDSFPIYLNKDYLKSLSSDYGWIGGYLNGKLKYVISFILKKKFIFKYVIFQSPVISVDSDISYDNEKNFLNNCIEIFSKMQVDFCAQPPTYVLFKSFPENSIKIGFSTNIIDLTINEDELWNNIHLKHRNIIKKAQSNGLKIKLATNEDLSKVFDLLKLTMKRSDLNFLNIHEFFKIINNLNNNVLIFCAFKNSEIVCCSIFPYSKFSSYYHFGGSIFPYEPGAMNLLHWEAIKYFKSIGVKKYDFVGSRINIINGSKLEGIQKFKNRFGGELQYGFLWKMAFNYKYYIYNFIFKIYNKGKTDLIDQELFLNNLKINNLK